MDPDQQFLDEAGVALEAAWLKYDLAPDADKPLLKPQVRMAYIKWLDIKLRLLEPGVLGSEGDLHEIRRLRTAIDSAADTQALVMGLAKVISLLSKFA